VIDIRPKVVDFIHGQKHKDPGDTLIKALMNG